NHLGRAADGKRRLNDLAVSRHERHTQISYPVEQAALRDRAGVNEGQNKRSTSDVVAEIEGDGSLGKAVVASQATGDRDEVQVGREGELDFRGHQCVGIKNQGRVTADTGVAALIEVKALAKLNCTGIGRVAYITHREPGGLARIIG